MLVWPQPGTAWGELSSGAWLQEPWAERGPHLHGTVEHLWAHGLTGQAGPLCSLTRQIGMLWLWALASG